MSSDLKRLVSELERVLLERGDSLDAPVRHEFEVQIGNLKREVDDAEVAEMSRLRLESLNVLATLLSLVTNVMTLLK